MKKFILIFISVFATAFGNEISTGFVSGDLILTLERGRKLFSFSLQEMTKTEDPDRKMAITERMDLFAHGIPSDYANLAPLLRNSDDSDPKISAIKSEFFGKIEKEDFLNKFEKIRKNEELSPVDKYTKISSLISSVLPSEKDIDLYRLSLIRNSGNTKDIPSQVEIFAVLQKLDVSEVTGESSTSKDDTKLVLPRVSAKLGKTASIILVREFSYPTEFDEQGRPTANEAVELGLLLKVTLHFVNGEISYSGSLQISTALDNEGAPPAEGSIPTIRTSKKAFTGKAKDTKPTSVSILSPSGENITLTLTFNLLNQEGKKVD